MISINRINLSFGGRILLNDISFQINPKDRIGLVGNNGAGKTTLLKILMGLQIPDTGTIEKLSGLTMGYLPQQMSHVDSKTLFNEVKTAFSQILELENKIIELNHEIGQRTDYHSSDYLKLINKLSDMNERIKILGALKINEQIEKTLLGLGFAPTDLPRQTKEFSGGWRMRIELAKILLKCPDLLLLDEPTNHLDIESIQWVEQFLADYHGAVVIISHDRALLDNVTNRTIEISLGRIYDYKVSYSKYTILRKEQRLVQLATYKNQQKLIADTSRFIERFRYKATRARQVQSRIRRLEKIRHIEVDEDDTKAIRIRFPAAPRSGNIVIDAADLSKSYSEKTVLENIDLVVRRGEKIAFVGKNGEGKTTLSRILVGDLDFTGNLKIGHNVKIGYFAQNQDELLDGEITVLDTIDRVAAVDMGIKIRALLGAFLFGSEDIDKKVKVLSGGERSRLALIKLLLEPFNFLVLDEPTNHLDMRSKDILKQALKSFTGTMILVSHDREFLDGLIDNVYEFKDHKIKKYPGNIKDFLEKKKIASLDQLEIKQKKTGSKTDGQPVSAGKDIYLEKKEFYKYLRKITKKITECENTIERLENELEELTGQLESPTVPHEGSGDNSLFLRYANQKKELDAKMYEWEQLHIELTELKKNRYYGDL
ncbi:glycosyl transferase family 2 [Candidatus Atribacteria bacterium RBG_16_35_8]|nr:MAG: glycosyl transferase family 2 [Candidatus Atribacteria bacterium RBG_16_35_8]